MTITGPIRAMAAITPTAIIATGAIMACAASAMATASIADMTGAITAAGTMGPRALSSARSAAGCLAMRWHRALRDRRLEERRWGERGGGKDKNRWGEL